MKARIDKIVAIMLFLVAGYSCNDNGELQNDNDEPQNQATVFYYYSGTKIYLQQITDKIFLKFSPDTNNELILSIIGRDQSLKPMYDINNNKNYSIRTIVLETKNGKSIPSATIEAFKAKTEVVSVSYLYQYNGQGYEGLTDEFVVKLKDTTSYEQLQELADKNSCKIGDENEFTKNQFMMYVSKTSNLDALQTSNLFYETGLFEYAEPNFIVFGAFGN